MYINPVQSVCKNCKIGEYMKRERESENIIFSNSRKSPLYIIV